jgi:hypothetical protein
MSTRGGSLQHSSSYQIIIDWSLSLLIFFPLFLHAAIDTDRWRPAPTVTGFQVLVLTVTGFQV